MKAEKTLRLAVMRNLTIDQQKELAELITNLSVAAKEYGEASELTTEEINARIVRANNAWSALLDIGLNTKY